MKKERKPKLIHSNFLFSSWEDDYTSGDDEDIRCKEHDSFECLMARFVNSAEFDTDCKADVDWKALYDCECYRNEDHGCNIINLRLVINILKKIISNGNKFDHEILVASLRSKLKDLNECVFEV